MRTWIVLAACCASATALADRGPAGEADAILERLKETWTLPELDPARLDDPESLREHQGRVRAILERRVDLIAELRRVAPDHPHLREFMMKRWAALMGRPLLHRRGDLVAEVGSIADDEADPLRVDAAFFRARLAIPTAEGGSFDAAAGAVDAFLAMAPGDDRGAQLLRMLARHPDAPPDRRAAWLDRLREAFGDLDADRDPAAARRRAEGIGKPFELDFRDARDGRPVSLRGDLRGRVVVLDFWATWCGPCVAEIPELERLHERYRGRGVEFIGVSLDEPGEDGARALRAFVERRAIPWPQFHGEAAGAFARSWGVHAIPAAYVVDAEGNLHSVDARGRLGAILEDLAGPGPGPGGDGPRDDEVSPASRPGPARGRR